MRDAAGQPADRFELLRLPQLFLERAPFGDVAHEHGDDGAAVGCRYAPPSIRRGISVPSALRPVSSICRLASGPSPVVMYALRALEVRGPFSRRQQELDVAAEDVHAARSRTSARRPGLNSRMFSWESIVRIASCAASRIAPWRASLSRPARYIRRSDTAAPPSGAAPASARSSGVTSIMTAAAAAPST